MTTRICVDGELGDERSARISVLDRGFLYGDSVYEVLRTYGGKPFALDEHMERLERSAELLAISLPLSREELVSEMRRTIEAAGNAESYVRLVITRGGGPIGLDPALAVDPTRVLIVTELRTLPEAAYETGVKISLIAAGRSAEGQLPAGAKSGNYLTNLLALQIAKERGAHEALLLDAHGRICEGSSSNVFVVQGQTIRTPPPEVGILEGITRRKVLALARGLGHPVEEVHLEAADLRRADEVFLTSTIREVLPVTEVDETRVGDARPGPIAKALRAAFPRPRPF
ncbi:MAG: aminotransferase [Proteobacteria bacterium]|nr:MAG: aminotransferase [Pseudomonadota bacterium]